MMKKILSSITVVLLAALLTVFAFAADGGYSSLALAELAANSGVDYTALVEGQEITVYIVVSPTLKVPVGKNSTFRPYGSAYAQKAVTTKDLYSQTYTVGWDSNVLELVEAPVVLSGISDSTADMKTNDGTDLYWVCMVNGSVNADDVIAATVSETWTNSVSVSYSNGGEAFTGFLLKGSSSSLSGCVAELTFKVKNVSADTDTDITLTDTYAVTSSTTVMTYDATNDATNKSLSVSVKAGCQHVNKSNENTVSSTCYEQGKYTYHCDDCGKDIEESLPFEAHNYKNAQGEDNRLNLNEPTCIGEGSSYLYCSNTGCTHYDEDTYQKVDALGHTWKEEVVSELTCTVDGKMFYYCSVCHRMAASAESTPDKNAEFVTTCFYNPEDGKCYKNYTAAGGHTVETDMPTSCHKITTAPGHDLVEGEDGSLSCNNTDICDIGGNFAVRYVGNSVKGSGATAEEYTDLAGAFEHFYTAGLSENAEAVIYLVEDITLKPHIYDSNNNKMTKSFEETPHDFHITITSLDTSDKAVITIPNTCNGYLLYGPTTFEHVNFKSNQHNSNRFIIARGFKLVMGEGLEMLNYTTAITASKTDAGIAGLGTTVTYSDLKLYVIGGFANEGGYCAIAGADPESVNVDVTVLSGTYYGVEHFNRNISNKNLTGATAKITIGDVTMDANYATSMKAVMNNCYTVVLYVGKSNIRFDYRYTYNNGTTGTGNVIERLYFPEASGSKVGDFLLNSTKNVGVTTNVYYYDDGSFSMEKDAIVNAFILKHDAVQSNAYILMGMEEPASITEWCYNKGEKIFGENGHYYGDDGICTFCGIKKCATHTQTEWVVALEPTCMEVGIMDEICLTCFEVVSSADIPVDVNAHNTVWMFPEGGVPTATCDACGTTLNTADGADFSNIYVSVNGFGSGGFSPKAPVNDYEAALKLAALADGDATIYIMDKIVISSNIASGKGYYAFLEPAHENEITVRGYKDNVAFFEFGGGVNVGQRATYNLNGPVKFENVEFSGGRSNQNIYICGRHNHLTFGENITADITRISNLTSQLVVTGGCYDETFECSGGDAHITAYSGNFYQIIGGNIRTDCSTPTIYIDILGNVSTSEQTVFGSYQKPAENIVVLLDGVLSSNKDITFAGDGTYTAGETLPASAENVTLILRSGTMISEAYNTAYLRPLGAAENNETPTTRINGKLYVYYDPDVSTTQTLYNRIAANSDRMKLEAHIMTADNICRVTNTAHNPAGEAIESVEATCYSEGYNKYVCADCGNEYKEVLEIIDHNLVDAGEVAANCANPARTKQVCSNEGCGAAVYTVVGTAVNPTAHNIVDGVCEYCRRTEVQICEADNGHELGDPMTVDGSCGSGTKRVCGTCGYVEVNIENATHNYGPYSITVEPTETTPGVKSRTCKSCGKVDTAILYSSDSVYTDPVATDAEGNVADFDIALSKLTKYERAAINALLQDTEYGSEVKVSYSVDADGVTGIIYSIPVPEEYNAMNNVKVVVKDDDGEFHVVDFKIEMGYIVFTF